MLMKKCFLIVIALMLAVPMMAQVDGETRHITKHRSIGLGIKGGVFLPNYYYRSQSDVEDLNALPYDTAWLNRIRPIAGVQVEIPVNDNLIFAPELLWIQRGDSRCFHNIPSGDDIRYTAKVNYLDLRVPVNVLFFAQKKLNPYLFAGPDFGLVMPYISFLDKNLSGIITEEQSNGSTNEVEVNASNMAPYDIGVFGGVGLRYALNFARFSLVMKLEAAYSLGLFETYSQEELTSHAPAANLGTGGTHYSVGHRYNRGMECTFSLVLPLHFMGGDACASFPNGTYGYGRGKSSF